MFFFSKKPKNNMHLLLAQFLELNFLLILNQVGIFFLPGLNKATVCSHMLRCLCYHPHELADIKAVVGEFLVGTKLGVMALKPGE